MAKVILFPLERATSRLSVSSRKLHSQFVAHCHRHEVFDETIIYRAWVRVNRRFSQYDVQRVAKVLPFRTITTDPSH